MQEQLITCKSGRFLVEINIHISHMPFDNYIQEASLSHCGKRMCVNYGKHKQGGSRSISVNSVTILASGIFFI